MIDMPGNIIFLFARWHELSILKMAAHIDSSIKRKAVVEFFMKEGIAARDISDD